MISNDDIKREFLAAGFEIKPGHDDLKPYVYEAARRVLALAAAHLEAEVARAGAAVRDQCASAAWIHYMDACKARKLPPSEHEHWNAARAVREA